MLISNNYNILHIAPSDVPNNVTIIAADSTSLLIIIEWQPPNTPNGITDYSLHTVY